MLSHYYQRTGICKTRTKTIGDSILNKMKKTMSRRSILINFLLGTGLLFGSALFFLLRACLNLYCKIVYSLFLSETRQILQT